MAYQISNPVSPPIGELCSLCSDLLQWLFFSFNTDSSALGMFSTVIQTRYVRDLKSTQCRICAFVHRNILSHFEKAKLAIHPSELTLDISPSIPINGNFQLSFRSVPDEFSYCLHFSAPLGWKVMQFGIHSFSSHLDDPNVWKLSRTWISDCMSRHVRCRSKNIMPSRAFATHLMNLELTISPRNIAQWFPTRLIDLGMAEDPILRPRLLVRDEDFDDSWKVAAYVTLSHCWGGCEEFKLRTDNIEGLREGINCPDLPKTFLDAMITAKSLSFRFLWIDSLCIIQDSVEDWSRESVLMTEVYSNSACNICALDAVDDAKGFLSGRDPFSSEPFVVRGTLHKQNVPFLVTNGPGRGLLHPTDILSSRAWVLQEQLLSPRCLMFSSTQVSWSCRELEASETDPSGSTLSPHLDDYPPDSTTRCVLSNVVDDKLLFRDTRTTKPRALSWDDPLANIWTQILDQYTCRNLTRSSDKLVAIAGIAEALSHRLGRYYAGIWGLFLPWSLLWHVNRSRRSRKHVQRILPLGAPSWSWASLDCSVTHIFDRLCYEYQRTIVQIMRVSTNYTGSEFGPVTKGEIVLRGFLGLATCEPGLFVDPNEPDGWHDASVPGPDDFILVINNETCGSIDFDEDFQDNQHPPEKLIILPVCSGVLSYNDKLGLSSEFLEKESLINPVQPSTSTQQAFSANVNGPQGTSAAQHLETGHASDGLGSTSVRTDIQSENATHVVAGLVLIPERRGVFKRIGIFEILGDKSGLARVRATWKLSTAILV